MRREEERSGGGGRVTVEPARAAHAAAMAELSALLGYPTPAADLGRRLEALEPSANTVCVALDGDEVVGWVHAFRSDRLEEDPFAELGGLIVAPERRGRGIGRQLMEAAERWARRVGCRKLRVRSHERRREAHRFYERVGYRRVKRQQVFDKVLGEETP